MNKLRVHLKIKLDKKKKRKTMKDENATKNAYLYTI